MPANPKYLSVPLQRFVKILAGVVGGYLVSVSVHLLLAYWLGQQVIITMMFSGFILWAGLLVLAFLAKNGWKVLGLYFLVSLVCFSCIYFLKT